VGPSRHGGGQLPAGTGKQLAAQGAAGAAVKRLVSTTGPVGATNAQGSSSSGKNRQNGGSGNSHRGATTSVSGASVHVPPVAGRGPLSALLHPIVSGSASGGAGILLPIFLVAALAAGIVAIVVRRRRLGSH
jgi:hypothetical protein